MSDLIKREDAIKALAEVLYDEPPHFNSIEKIEAYAKRELSRIPSAEPKQGEWIKHDEERDYCSACKHIFKTRTLTKQDKWTTYVDDLGYNFCPNCGARMEGVDDE
jgi:hypothetical protein